MSQWYQLSEANDSAHIQNISKSIIDILDLDSIVHCTHTEILSFQNYLIECKRTNSVDTPISI